MAAGYAATLNRTPMTGDVTDRRRAGWRAAGRVGIIPVMPLRRSRLKRFVAALLPVMFLWLCAACVSNCSRETASADDHTVAHAQAGLTEVRGAPECDGCPFVSFPKATAPERAALDAGSEAPRAEGAPTPPTHSAAAATFVRPPALPPATAPPLELLSTLRI